MYEEIQEKIRRKGWDLYDAGSDLEQNLYIIVPKGNTTCLDKNRNYLILPAIKQPTNISEMEKALENLQMQKMYPLIKYKQVSISTPAFIILEDGVKVYSQRILLFSLDEFIQSLDTLVDRIMN